MQNKQFSLTKLICGLLLCFILFPIFSFIGGYFLGWLLKVFLSNPIIHALLVFGITILPEHIPYICATLSMFYQMASFLLKILLRCLHSLLRH